jgi:hypothetical protein
MAYNKDKRKAYNKEYYKEYYEKNKDQIKARGKAYYEANKDKIKARGKAYLEANKDKIKARNKAYYETNKDKIKAYRKAYSLTKRYNLTLEGWKELLKKQNYLCPICRQQIHEKGKNGLRPVVDHNHDTGKVRAIVHSNCNTIIGMSQEQAQIHLNAARYLQQHKEE